MWPACSTYIIIFPDNTLQLKVGPLPELLKMCLFSLRRRGTTPTELCLIPRVSSPVYGHHYCTFHLLYTEGGGVWGYLTVTKKLQCLLTSKVMIIKTTSGF